jgi:hypothetical protein
VTDAVGSGAGKTIDRMNEGELRIYIGMALARIEEKIDAAPKEAAAIAVKEASAVAAKVDIKIAEALRRHSEYCTEAHEKADAIRESAQNKLNVALVVIGMLAGSLGSLGIWALTAGG